MLGNKALRSMENTIYGNRKQHNENRDFCFFLLFFFLRIKTLNLMQNTIYGERENIREINMKIGKEMKKKRQF